MPKKIWLYDRSRVVTDWSCPRKRYFNYHFGGKGIVKSTTSLELFMGTTIHDGLAAIATLTKANQPIDIDAIAAAAFNQMVEGLTPKGPNFVDPDYIKEQATLVEGLLRGFYKHVWPRLILSYPEILFIEAEMKFPHDSNGQESADPDFIFMSKPDLILSDGEGSAVYFEYKSTASKKEEWVNSWETAVQLHSTVRAVRATHGLDVESVIVQGLYKGYCLAPSTPVLTADLRWVPVGSLVEGDKIAGFDEHPKKNRGGHKSLREWKEASVSRTGRQKLPSYEIVLEDGTTFVCSENHQWLCAWKDQGTGSAVWRTTKDLTKKHRIVKLIEPWTGYGEFTDHEAGYLAAAFDGEGNLAMMNSINLSAEGIPYKSVGLAFTQNPNQMLDFVRTALTKHGYYLSPNTKRSGKRIETLQIYGKINVMGLMGKLQPKRLIPKWNFNNLGMIKDLPTRPVKIVSIKPVGLKEVVTLETTTGTLIANGFASHNSSYGKQTSPFCYAYKRPGNPPFTEDQISYDYKAGFKKYPTWELPGGVKGWIEGMSFQTLTDQFPQTQPIFLNEALIDSFFKQQAGREDSIRHCVSNIKIAVENDLNPGVVEGLLNQTFPQRFDQCVPSFGRPCSYRKLCHGPEVDPIEEGYTWREPHHEAELEAQAEP